MFDKLAKPTPLAMLLAFGGFFVVLGIVHLIVNAEWFRGTAEEGGQATPVRNERTGMAHNVCAAEVARRSPAGEGGAASDEYTAWDIGFNRYLVKAGLEHSRDPRLSRRYVCRVLYLGGRFDDAGNWEVQSIGYEGG